MMITKHYLALDINKDTHYAVFTLNKLILHKTESFKDPKEVKRFLREITNKYKIDCICFEDILVAMREHPAHSPDKKQGIWDLYHNAVEDFAEAQNINILFINCHKARINFIGVENVKLVDEPHKGYHLDAVKAEAIQRDFKEKYAVLAAIKDYVQGVLKRHGGIIPISLPKPEIEL